jgi:hypothetical protein
MPKNVLVNRVNLGFLFIDENKTLLEYYLFSFIFGKISHKIILYIVYSLTPCSHSPVLFGSLPAVLGGGGGLQAV